MKAFMSSILCKVKQFLFPKLRDAKQFLSSKLCGVKQLLSPNVCKLLVLIFALLLVLLVVLSKCSGGKSPSDDVPASATEGESIADTTQDLSDSQADVNVVICNMGTITADKLNIRKGPDSEYEANGAYFKGDRIEILETQTVEDTTWGRTNLGWIGMGYVRMDDTANPDVNPQLISNGDTAVLGYGVVDLKELNVRLGPGTDYEIVGTVTQGIRYAYYQLSSSNENWVRIDNGWVSMEHFYLEGTVANDALTGTVTTEDLNIRTGPSTSFQSVDTYQTGETVEILAQVGAWGYTEKGWIFMNYVEPNEPVYTTGTVTVTRGLNVRQESNADSEIVATLVEGNIVTVLEVDGGWGRTVQGWINLKYVKYE